jgi:pimeloyl-ACP methyl ester carboxylesterase
VVRGAGDAIVPDAAARRLAAVLPAGRFARVSGAAHAVQYNSPAVFVSITLAFLAGASLECGSVCHPA